MSTAPASGWIRDGLSRLPAAPDDGGLRTARYTFADVELQVATDEAALLEELEAAYADCAALPEPARRARISCTLQRAAGGSLARLHVDAPMPLDLLEAAHGLTAPRAILQHLQPGEPTEGGWRALEDRRTGTPVLAARGPEALLDLAALPHGFLGDYVVGLAFLAQPSLIFLHGGAVDLSGSGTLVTGHSGAGKSTLAAELATRGHALLGDETVALRAATGELLPVRSTLQLRPGPRSTALAVRLAGAPRRPTRDGHGVWGDMVRPSALFPREPSASGVPLRSALFIRSRGARAAVEPFTPTLEHLPHLQPLAMSMTAVVAWTRSPARRLMHFVRLLELLGNAQCAFLDLGPPGETAELVERTVRERWH